MTEDAGNDASAGDPEGLQPAVMGHSTHSKACTACCSPIPVDATLCSECGSHQTPWLKNLLILARVSGLIAATVAAATYAAATYETVRKAIAWRNEIILVDYYSEGSITITNRSDGPVFVTNMDVRAVTEEGESFREFPVVVNRRIEPQDFVSFDQSREQERRFKDYIGAACETPGACGLAQSSILVLNTHLPWIADWMLALENRRHAERWK